MKLLQLDIMQTKILINNSISGILSIPDNNETKIPIVLLLHGFGSNKNEVNNTFSIAADKLLDQGIGTLRIDFRGFGESTGNTSETTIENMLSDASHALEYILHLPCVDIQRIGVCGFSLGAGISILVTTDSGNTIKSMCLLSPTGELSEDFKSYLGFDNYHKVEMAKDAVEIDLGWRKIKLKDKFINSLKQYHIKDALASYKGSFFAVAGTRDSSCANAESLIDLSQSRNKKLRVMQDADHIFNAFDEEKSQMNLVINELVGWFRSTL